MRKLIIIFVSLAVTIGLAALIAPAFFNSKSLKSTLEQMTLRQTGYTLSVAGDIDIRLLPTPRVRLSDVTMVSPAFGGTPFVKMKMLDVGVKLSTLLGGPIEVTRLALHAPDINLVQTESGNNWSALFAQPSQKPAPKPNNAKQDATLTPKSFVLHELEIRDGKVLISDNTTVTKVHLDKLNIDSSMSSYDQPVKIKGGVQWNGQPIKFAAKLGSLQSFQYGKETPLEFSWDSTPLDLSFNGRANQLRLLGDIKLKSPAINAVYAWLSGMQMVKQKAIPLEMNGSMDCSRNQCMMEKINSSVDDIKFTGDVSLNMAEQPVRVVVDVKADKLDITPYLAQKTASNFSLIASAYAQTKVGRWSNDPIDLSALKSLNANISVAFNELIAGAFKAGKGTFRAKNDKGVASAELVDTAMYEGKANVFVNLDANSKVDGRAMLVGIQTEPLLNALFEKNRFSGKASSQFAFASNLKSQQAFVENLDGSGILAINDGSIKGLDIASMVRSLQSAYKEVDTSQKKTDFSEMRGSFTIVDGVLKNDDLMMKAPLFRVGGKGSVNLPAYTINYLLTPQIVETIQGQGGKEKEGLGVPILVSGDLSSPTYAPDAKGLINDVLKNPDKVKDTVNQLKGLFKTPKTHGVAPGTAPAGTIKPPANNTPQQKPTSDKPMNQLKNMLKGL